jgi:threonine/homoserine/homoserine lactone efflux protein
MLVFYLAVLPQFLGPNAGLPVLIYALSHAALSLIYLTLLVAGMSRALRLLARRRVRRVLDGVTGLV